MQCSGRYTVLGIVWITFMMGVSYLYVTDGFVHNKVIILALLPYTVLGWWMGKRYDQLKYYSQRDTLTNTYNRRFVYKTFPKMRIQADRRNRKFAVYIIDVDDFKQVNDTFGHTAGDLVLKTIARSLHRMKQESDLIARWGGDEFIMIASYSDDILQKMDIHLIEESLAELSQKLTRKVFVSIGRSVYPDDARSLDDLIKIADYNMYELKHNRKELIV